MKKMKVLYRRYKGLLIKVLILGTKVLVISMIHLDTVLASPPWTITCEYGSTDPLHPKGHKGVDFALPDGTELKSVVDGEVEAVSDTGKAGYGRAVRIRTSDGRTIIYGHLRDMAVHTGDSVDFGEVIGHSGNTGRSTGPHLHFEVRINGKAINPMPTIQEGMMRKALTVGR